MKQMCAKPLITGALALALVAIGFAPAYAIDFKISGQVNQVIFYADDGDETDVIIADNDNSSTRIRATGSEDFGSVTAGFEFEIEAERNTSSAAQINQDDDGIFNWGDRKLNVYFDTMAGKIELGKGDTAANGTTEVDLSGTGVIAYSSPTDVGGGILWKNDDGSLFGGDTGDKFSNFDGYLSRASRIRYNTPNFAGLTLAGSAANGGAWDTALWYAAEFGGNKLAAAIGYVNPEGRADTVDSQWGGSVSWLAPFGLNLTAAYGSRQFAADGRDDAVGYYGKIGYKVGIHAISIDYQVTEDLDANNEEATSYALAYVIKPWSGVEIFASGRIFSLDVDTGNDPEDVLVIAAGSRIKF